MTTSPPFRSTARLGFRYKSMESTARRDWTRKNTTMVTLKLNNNTDSDLLAALNGKSKQTEIKRLLRLAIEAERKSVP